MYPRETTRKSAVPPPVERVRYADELRQTELRFVRRLLGEIADGTIDGLDIWQAWHDGSPTPEFALAGGSAK